MGSCPRSGGLIVTVDIDLGDVQPAVSQNGGGGFQISGGFNCGRREMAQLLGGPLGNTVLFAYT
jgi:hypothetical protein